MNESQRQMRLLHKKSRPQRLLKTVTNSLDVPSRIKSGLPDAGSAQSLKAGLTQGTALKAGLIAGGVAGLTAGSAGISSLRRRTTGARSDS